MGALLIYICFTVIKIHCRLLFRDVLLFVWKPTQWVRSLENGFYVDKLESSSLRLDGLVFRSVTAEYKVLDSEV